MILTLNGFTINDATNNTYIDQDLLGLALPPIRTSSGNYAGRAGGYVGGQFFGMRDVPIQGKLFSSDIATLEATRKNLQTALLNQVTSGSNKIPVTVTIVTNAGSSYLIFANLVSFEMPIDRNLFSASFSVELLAPDPTIYDNATGTALSTTISRVTSGGLVFPVVFPAVFAAASSPTTVTNSGTTAVYPTVTLSGTLTNPVVTNRTTNAFVGLNLTTGPTDVISIDMRQRTITLNGGSIFASQTAGSSFWSLPPGGNLVALTTSGGTDTGTGTVSWRNGFYGI